MTRGLENAVKDLRFAAHVELGRRLIEEHDPGSEPHGAKGPRQGDTLPLASREICAARVAASKDRIEAGQARGARLGERLLDVAVRSAGRSHVVAQRQLEADEVLKDGGHARAPAVKVQGAKVNTVHLDGAVLRVIEPAKKLRDRGLTGAVLADDGERRAGGNRQVEVRQALGRPWLGRQT